MINLKARICWSLIIIYKETQEIFFNERQNESHSIFINQERVNIMSILERVFEKTFHCKIDKSAYFCGKYY